MASKTYTQLLKELSKKQKEAQPAPDTTTESDIARIKETKEVGIRLKGLEDYFNMRQQWGSFLRICLAAVLLFNILLVIFVGLGILKFSDEWFLRLVLTTNLADIIGLVYLVVKFLFSSQDQKVTPQDPQPTKS